MRWGWSGCSGDGEKSIGKDMVCLERFFEERLVVVL